MNPVWGIDITTEKDLKNDEFQYHIDDDLQEMVLNAIDAKRKKQQKHSNETNQTSNSDEKINSFSFENINNLESYKRLRSLSSDLEEMDKHDTSSDITDDEITDKSDYNFKEIKTKNQETSPKLKLETNEQQRSSVTKLIEHPNNCRSIITKRLYDDFRKILMTVPELKIRDDDLKLLTSKIKNEFNKQLNNQTMLQKLRDFRLKLTNKTFFRKVVEGQIKPEELPKLISDDRLKEQQIIECEQEIERLGKFNKNYKPVKLVQDREKTDKLKSIDVKPILKNQISSTVLYTKKSNLIINESKCDLKTSVQQTGDNSSSTTKLTFKFSEAPKKILPDVELKEKEETFLKQSNQPTKVVESIKPNQLQPNVNNQNLKPDVNLPYKESQNSTTPKSPPAKVTDLNKPKQTTTDSNADKVTTTVNKKESSKISGINTPTAKKTVAGSESKGSKISKTDSTKSTKSTSEQVEIQSNKNTESKSMNKKSTSIVPNKPVESSTNSTELFSDSSKFTSDLNSPQLQHDPSKITQSTECSTLLIDSSKLNQSSKQSQIQADISNVNTSPISSSKSIFTEEKSIKNSARIESKPDENQALNEKTTTQASLIKKIADSTLKLQNNLPKTTLKKSTHSIKNIQEAPALQSSSKIPNIDAPFSSKKPKELFWSGHFQFFNDVQTSLNAYKLVEVLDNKVSENDLRLEKIMKILNRRPILRTQKKGNIYSIWSYVFSYTKNYAVIEFEPDKENVGKSHFLVGNKLDRELSSTEAFEYTLDRVIQNSRDKVFYRIIIPESLQDLIASIFLIGLHKKGDETSDQIDKKFFENYKIPIVRNRNKLIALISYKSTENRHESDYYSPVRQTLKRKPDSTCSTQSKSEETKRRKLQK